MTDQLDQDLAGAPLGDGVLTFVLTDIEGSVNKWEAKPGAMRDALRRHDTILREHMSRGKGHIFRTLGDSFHTAFAVPAVAVEAAVAAARDLARADFSAVDGLNVRVAIHAGPVEARDGDYFGQGINRAARLLSVAYGGQVLLSGTVANMIAGELPSGVTLIDLGSHFLRDRTDAERIYQITAADLPSSFPPLKSPGIAPNNLPRGLTSFVGRTRELAGISASLERARLVTLLGIGGAGKTRLAIEAAGSLAAVFPDGLWFVDLSGVSDPHLVADRAGTVIGARSSPDQSGAASLVAALHDKTCLVILDNCEHVLEAAAELADRILRACPFVSVLATSRQPLAIHGERIYRVTSLALPDPGPLTAASAVEYPSIRLFLDRASAVNEMMLTDDNANWVADICRQLDGIPLAIELAAAQLRIVTPQHLASQLRESFALQSRLRTTPGRHRTLAATLDWSYRLLTDDERKVLERMAAFASGCTIDAARAVCAGDDVAPEAIPDLIADLVDKSLVVAEVSGPAPRTRLLETTRRYALQRLLERGEATATRRRFAMTIAEIFRQATDAWPGAPTETWLQHYEPELDNMRAALDWAFGPEGDLLLGAALVSFSLRLWDELGLLPERQRWFERALAEAPATIPLEMRARLYLGRTSLSGAADPTRFGIAENAIKLLRELPPGIDLGEALAKAGAALLTPGTVAEAAPYLIEARDILSRFGPTKQLSACLRSMCAMQFFQDDLLGARGYGLEAESVARRIGDMHGMLSNTINLAEVDFASGDVERAIATAERVMANGKGPARLFAVCQANLASYRLVSGDLDRAAAAAVDEVRRARSLAWASAVVRSLGQLALIAARRGSADIAAQLVGYIETASPDWAGTNQPIEKILYERLRAEIAAELPSDQLEVLRAAGAKWDEAEAVGVAIATASGIHGPRERHPATVD